MNALTGQSAEPTATSGGPKRLSGHMTMIELLLTVLAYSAPVSVVSGYIAFVILFGGISAPAVFLLVTLLLLLFTVGFTTMTRYVEAPGAFYTYITEGLGRVAGLSGAFLAIFGYLLLGLCSIPFFSICADQLVVGSLGGKHIPWYWYGLVAWALCGFLSYLEIDLSAKVLAVTMVLELLLVLAFNLVIVHNGGPAGIPGEPFTWQALNSGAFGVAALFCVTCFIGFEATAVFRDEVRDPDTTVPRATYLAVALVGLFYTVSSWMIIAAYGADGAVAAAKQDPAGMFSAVMLKYVGQVGVDTVRVLLVTSVFAAMLAAQNIVARYFFNLGRGAVLPSVLGKVHPKHRSPYVSALLVSAIWLVCTAVFAFKGSDPAMLYGQIAALGGFSILILMLLTSVAVVVFFRRKGPVVGATLWHTLIAPTAASFGLAVAVALAFQNFDLLTGAEPTGHFFQIEYTIFLVAAAGALLALYCRRVRPLVYARIGARSL